MSGRLPDWLAQWLGIQPSNPGDSAAWRIEFVWSWPPWATVLLVLAAVTWVVVIYRHEASSAGRGYRSLLAVLRLTAIALLLAMISQVWITLQQTGPPALTVLVDRSASMGLTDLANAVEASPSDQTTRLEQAKSLLLKNDGKLIARLAGNYRLQVAAVADRVEQLPSQSIDTLADSLRGLSADGPGSGATRLGDAVHQVLERSRGAPPAAIVLLTDGVVTAGQPLADAARAAREAGVQVVAVGLGSDVAPRDIELVDVLVDDVVFRDDLVSFTIQLRSSGLAGEAATVTLHEVGSATPLAEQSITLAPDGELQTVFLTHRPTAAGEIAYVVEVTPRNDETNSENNRQRRIVDVRDEKTRVLVAFGYPSYEFRFLKTLLERDDTIALSTYLQDADPDYAEQDRTALRSFPVAHDELLGYEVLVLGDLDPQRLPRSVWADIHTFVAEKGGGVVFVAGPRWLPWSYADLPEAAALMPIDLPALSLAGDALPADVTRGFAVRPTPLGLRLPPLQLGDTPAETEEIWRHLPPLYWLAPTEKLAPAAQVLAEHPTHTSAIGRPWPVIITQYAGAGRVWFHATDSTWRWRLGAGDVYFARYWVQTIRYLARGMLAVGAGATLTTDRREYEPGERVEIRLRYRDPRFAPSSEDATIVVESPGQARQRATLRRSPTVSGLFEGALAGLAAGQYDLMVDELQSNGVAPRARFAVVAPASEMARTAMDRAALTAAAATTRGEFYTLADADRLADELPRGRRMPIANLPPIELWNRWWLLAPFLAAMIAEWILRKRKGML